MNTEKFELDGLRFQVTTEPDSCSEAPWVEGCTLGAVRMIGHKSDKLPGEMIFAMTRSGARYAYDFAGAVKEARSEGLSGPNAVKAAYGEMAWFRGYVEDDWYYVVVCVELLTIHDEPTGECEYLGSVESSSADYILEVARQLAGQLAMQYEGVTAIEKPSLQIRAM
jgi:hypothetical protein